MWGLPPEKNPLNYPPDPSRSMGKDLLRLLGGIAVVVLTFGICLLVLGPGLHQWGTGYAVGFLVGVAFMCVTVRILHGHWPGD